MSFPATSSETALAPKLAQSALPRRTKLLFGVGDMVDGSLNFGLLVFVFYYLTAVCGMSGTTAGAILSISIVIDAIADPLIGSISDNTRSRLGRRLPYMFASALPAAAAFGFLFSAPSWATGWVLVAYAGLSLLVLRLAGSFFILPYSALGAELTDSYTERSMVSAYRVFFNCVANVITLCLGYLVFMQGRDGLLDREAYAGFGWSTAFVALAAALATSFAMLPERRRLKMPAGTGKFGPMALINELAEVFRNGSFRSLFLCCLLFWTALGYSTTLAIHANLYFWNLPSEIIAALPFANLAGYIVGVPLATYALNRFEKRDVSLCAIIVMAALQALPPILQIMGYLPGGTALHGLLGVAAFAGGVFGTLTFLPFISMMSDAVDEHELLFGTRREGMYFAGLLLSVKAAAGIGGMLAGLSLDAIHFPQDLSDGVFLTQEVVNNLGIVQGPAAAAIGAMSALMLVGYRLTETKLTRIQQELAARGAPSVSRCEDRAAT